MSLETTGDALDAVSEVEEINDIPDSEPSTQLPEEAPEIPDERFDASIENIKGPEEAEKIVGTETSKAEAVIDFTEGALETAKGATENPDLFAAEESELNALKAELKDIIDNENPDTETNEDNKPKVGRETNSTEEVTTISPEVTPQTENKQGKSVDIHGIEIANLTETEAELTERAANVVYYSGEKAQSIDEIRGLITQLETLNAREFPDDAKFDRAVGVFMQESKYLEVNTPFTLENGAVDLATGKVTPIEIIASDEERAAVTRPTPEQLKQAETDMLSTSHGKIISMLAYLKDYEAVASGKMEPYHALMPQSKLMELKRKSWFEAKEETKPDSAQEVVGGLALTWEDTAEYYESIGNTSTAEQIRSTGRFEVSEHTERNVIIGEQHLRLVNIPEYQQRFETYLASLKSEDFVIVEHTSDPKRNAWTTLSSETRFMQQAEMYPNETNGVRLEVMDTTSKWEAWENSAQELGIDREDFFFTNGVLDASQRIFAEGGIEKLIADIQGNEILTEKDKKTSLQGVQRFMQILMSNPEQSKQQLEQLTRLRQLYTQVDSTCRERLYQQEVAEFRTQNPEAKLLVVVGNAHREGVAETMNNSAYRTEFDAEAVEELKENIEEFK